MDIGKSHINNDKEKELKRLRQKELNDLTPTQRRFILDNFKEEYWNPAWNNQQLTDQGITFPKIANKYGNILCNNDQEPDLSPPKELFNFDLILNSRKFRVICDTLLRIKTEEDLSEYDELHLQFCLEQCASYRMTCFCAYIGAHKEYRKWKAYHEEWMAEKRQQARGAIRIERISDKTSGLKKDIGQITGQEIEDWIIIKYGSEHRHNKELIDDWEENEKVFLELRDTLKERGNHLQSILKRVKDHIDSPMSDGSSTE